MLFTAIGLHEPHGPSEMKIKFHGVKMMEKWPPARRAYGSERTMEYWVRKADNGLFSK